MKPTNNFIILRAAPGFKLQAQLLAKLEGVTLSELIRRAIEERAQARVAESRP